eukprot:486609_1
MNNDVYIIGVSQFNTKRLTDLSPPISQLQLISNLLDAALQDASQSISRRNLNGLISMYPGFGAYNHVDDSLKFASAGYYSQSLATKLNLYEPFTKPFITRNYICGGATPVSQCLQAKYIINNMKDIDCVATMIMQTPNSSDRKKFIEGRNSYYNTDLSELNLNTNPNKKVIAVPALYNAHTEQFMNKYGKQYGITRKHLAMIPILMHRNGYDNKDSLSYQNNKLLNATVDTILNSKDVGCKYIKQYECARLSDGGFCLIIANKKFITKHNINMSRCFKMLGGAEYDQALKHKPYLNSNDMRSTYSMFNAIKQCYINSKCSVDDIDWFGIYDCYPITVLLGMLAIGLCNMDNIASYLQRLYDNKSLLPIPINSHGGLLAFGAPTCVPSGFCIVEAIKQLRFETEINRQIRFQKNKKLKALIFGNGGILQQSSAIIIERSLDDAILSKL